MWAITNPPHPPQPSEQSSILTSETADAWQPQQTQYYPQGWLREWSQLQPLPCLINRLLSDRAKWRSPTFWFKASLPELAAAFHSNLQAAPLLSLSHVGKKMSVCLLMSYLQPRSRTTIDDLAPRSQSKRWCQADGDAYLINVLLVWHHEQTIGWLMQQQWIFQLTGPAVARLHPQWAPLIVSLWSTIRACRLSVGTTLALALNGF